VISTQLLLVPTFSEWFYVARAADGSIAHPQPLFSSRRAIESFGLHLIQSVLCGESHLLDSTCRSSSFLTFFRPDSNVAVYPEKGNETSHHDHVSNNASIGSGTDACAASVMMMWHYGTARCRFSHKTQVDSKL
jgi:hypothetical protein